MLIQRPEYLRFLQEWREKQVIKVVTAIRRCGKSTLFDLYRDFLKQDATFAGLNFFSPIKSMRYK